MVELLRKHERDIADICRRLNVQRLEVFGSAAKGHFDPDRSDIDLVVEFRSPEEAPGLLTRYLQLAEQLEDLLGKKVDLLTPQSIRNPYFRRSVDATRELLYAA